MNLLSEFERIRKKHRKAIRITAARVVLGSSVIRVLKPGTKKDLLSSLVSVKVNEMCKLRNKGQFQRWFEKNLESLSKALNRHNAHNHRVHPGYKWGHATKVLTLYLREIVLNRRYFSDSQVKRTSPWLYTPLDGIVIKRLRRLGCPLPFKAIKEIDTPEKFYDAQDLLGVTCPL